jgi:hypothetical protein
MVTSMEIILMGIAIVAIVVFVITAVYVMIGLRETLSVTRKFFGDIDRAVTSTAAEVSVTLKSIRETTDTANSTLNGVNELSASIRTITQTLLHVTGTVKRVSNGLDIVTSAMSGNFFAAKAGIATALSVIRKGLHK